MKKKGFTFIEIIVVISIMVIISSTGIFYFFKQISGMKLASEIDKIKDNINYLDAKVDKKEILDYSVEFKKADKIGFVYTENNLGLDCGQFLNLNFTTFDGSMSTNCPLGESFEFKIYGKLKFKGKKIIDSSQNFNFSFSNEINYGVIASNTGTVLNNLFLTYYSKENLIKENENKLELIGIYGNNNKTGGNYNSVEIKNLNGKKYIIPDGGSETDKIYLFFEREGIEKFVEIKK